MEPEGTILFSTVGVSYYGFDVFSVSLASTDNLRERRHTDGTSVNFNAQFLDEGDTVVFISERTGSSRIHTTTTGPSLPPRILASGVPNSLFHDRPTVRNHLLFFVSAHEPPSTPFKSWAAIYSTPIIASGESESLRLTPPDAADLSPAVSPSGDLIAVASYGDGPWNGDFHELQTSIIAFAASDPSYRAVLARRGGWPAWSGEKTLFFHRVADDGWWSVFRLDLDLVDGKLHPAGEERRITPPGIHAFTPSATHDGRRIAVATRRKGRRTRQIEIFDLETEQFHPVTELINPDLHHYNPFFSPSSGHLGYHRFRGEDAGGDSTIPHLQPVRSPVSNIRMLRLHLTFPSVSPDGSLIAVNGDFMSTPGLMVVRSDGTRRWTVVKENSMFYTSWSGAERGVVFTSVGPIFESIEATVQIARVSFNPDDLDEEHHEVESDVKLLTRGDTGNNAFPSGSPDGKHVVFRSGRSGYKNLYVTDAMDGEMGEIRRLTEGEWTDTMPCWSPDGEEIAFSSNRHDPTSQTGFGVYLVRPDGTEVRRVVVAGGGEEGRERINHVCFSPDSKWLLFTGNMGGVVAEPVALPNQFQPYGDLYVCRLDGTGLRRLTFNAYENGTPAWMAGDGGVGLSVRSEAVGDKLRGQFDEPLWMTCDM